MMFAADHSCKCCVKVGISDYGQYGWYSIGSRYVDGGHVIFRGSLDGQNHVIKNFTSTYRPSNNPLPAGIDPGRYAKEPMVYLVMRSAPLSKTSGSIGCWGYKDFVAQGQGMILLEAS
jgi:hypothetical protein